MKNKTYPSDRVLGNIPKLILEIDSVLKDSYYLEDKSDVFIGVIAHNHRLFLTGDVVLFDFHNGSGQNWMVSSFSSKGFLVKNFYMKFQSWNKGSEKAFTNQVHLCFDVENPSQHLIWSKFQKKWLSSDSAAQLVIAESLRTRFVA
jgi:hypothetical protein